jgi:hypothetical protein
MMNVFNGTIKNKETLRVSKRGLITLSAIW